MSPTSITLPDPQTVDLDGPLSYREWEGPADTTFVMVHGLGGSSLNWMQVAPGLAGLGRVLAPDLPGFGTSPRTGRPTGVMDLRRVLSRFVAGAASDRVVMCGNSMGGALSIIEAAIEPTAVAGLVLTGCVFPWAARSFPAPAVMAAFAMYRAPRLGERFLDARTMAMSPEQAVRLGLRYVAADWRTIPEEVTALHVELMRDRRDEPEALPAFLDAARSLMRLGRRPDVARRALDHVRCPVLVLHGGRDRLVPAAFARAELARHPSWRGRIFPDLGHAPQMEAPDRWLDEVSDWFAGMPD
jgi:pimeloyl-ACP methyl ester carboxylesterase